MGQIVSQCLSLAQIFLLRDLSELGAMLDEVLVELVARPETNIGANFRNRRRCRRCTAWMRQLLCTLLYLLLDWLI